MRVFVPEWDVRNFGVECLECDFEISDSFESVLEIEREILECPYVTVRVPPSQIQILYYLESIGFIMSEVAMNWRISYDDLRLPRFLEKRVDMIDWKEMDDSDLKRLYEEINKGIFQTDRISLDPLFGRKVSSKRYCNWINDLVCLGQRPACVVLDNKTIGFFIVKRIDKKTYSGILGGLYEEVQGRGLGIAVQYATMKYIHDHGAQIHDAHCSINNTDVWKTLSIMGFELSGMDYVLVKHNA